MYRERRSVVPGAVVWTTTAGEGRVLPDGCMDLIWMGGEVVVAGPDTSPYVARGRAGDVYTGLRFAPGALPRLLGVPATALLDSRVPLHDVMAGAGGALADQVAEAPDPGRALESFAQGRLAPDSRAETIVRLVRQGEPVSTVADQVNLGSRQLHRWSLRHFGYGPKVLARILRLQSALSIADSERSDAVVAARAGYADQAHLIREARDLTGVSFAALVR